MNELSPCPFCGSAVELHHDTSSDYERQWTYTVRCPNPNCGCDFGHYETVSQVAQKWNTRHVVVSSEIEIAFHNWLISYEVDSLERWSNLFPDEWNILIEAQWEKFKAELAEVQGGK